MFRESSTQLFTVKYHSNPARKMSFFTLDDKNYISEKLLGEGMEGRVRLFLAENHTGRCFAVKDPAFDGMPSFYYDKEKTLWNKIHPDSPSYTADSCARFIMPYLGEKELFQEMKVLAKTQNIEYALLLFIAVAEEIQRVNDLDVHHKDIHKHNIMIKRCKGYYEAFCIDLGFAIDSKERAHVDESAFRNGIVKHHVWNNFPELTKIIKLWNQKYLFSEASFPVQIAMFKFNLAMDVYFAEENFLKANNIISQLLESKGAKEYPKKLLLDLKFSHLKLQFILDPEKFASTKNTLTIADLTAEIKNYDKENSGLFQGRTETIKELLRIRNRAIVSGIKELPIEFIEDILVSRATRNSFFRAKSHYSKTNLLKTEEDIDEAKLSATEKVIYHLGKKIKR